MKELRLLTRPRDYVSCTNKSTQITNIVPRNARGLERTRRKNGEKKEREVWTQRRKE